MSVEVGQKLQGKITGITKFGAFVDIGDGKSGMVHISQVSNGFIESIEDVLSVGDEVTVKVVNIAENGKIGLSIKQASEEKLPPKKEFKPKQAVATRTAPRENVAEKSDFDSLMSSFLKDSGERLSSLRRNTESKRGGRGGRRG